MKEISPLLDHQGKPISPRKSHAIANSFRPKIWIAAIVASLSVMAGVIANIETVKSFICSNSIIPCPTMDEQRLRRVAAMLESTEPATRLDGIKIATKIARDNGTHHQEILSMMAGFVRQRAPWRANVVRTTIDADVQQALSLIGSLPKVGSGGVAYKVDMHNVDISDAMLEGGNFEGVVLWGSNLRKAKLARANFKDADLGGVDFTEASLEMANLEGAKLWFSNLLDPKRATILQDALLGGANLKNADLSAADMRGARDITAQQLKEAILNENTKLPANLSLSAGRQ
jgi:hypothetical protein